MMKKLLSLVLALALAATMLVLPASAVNRGSAEESARLLYNLGLFWGIGVKADGSPNFDLERAPTRAEAITILVRLLGAEAQAQDGTWTLPFVDVPDWAYPYVGYAYSKGYTYGVDPTHFNSSGPVSATQFLTFLLRALGYQDGTDFTWNSAWTLTDPLKISNGEYQAGSSFLRADAVKTAANALTAPKKDGDTTILQELRNAGVIPDSAFVIWNLEPVNFQTNFASFLFYPVNGSPSSFTSFKLDKVTVNGLGCQTLQLTTPAGVSAYLASIGHQAGGFGYVEVTYDQELANQNAERYTDSNGLSHLLLNFTFDYTAIQTDGVRVTGTFSQQYYLD